jgi:hypothetical protein
MSDLVSRPTHISCGHCGATAAVSWVPTGDGIWEATGRCSSCRWVVHSFTADDPAFFEFLLAQLPSTFPDARVTLHFGSSKSAKFGAGGGSVFGERA